MPVCCFGMSTSPASTDAGYTLPTDPDRDGQVRKGSHVWPHLPGTETDASGGFESPAQARRAASPLLVALPGSSGTA